MTDKIPEALAVLDDYQLGALVMQEKIAQALEKSPRKPIYESAEAVRELSIPSKSRAIAWHKALAAVEELK